MGRALVILNSYAAREKATDWIARAPKGTRVEFKSSKRTLPQNDRMWAMLTDVATQDKRKLQPPDWKVLFIEAAGMDSNPVPSLDGERLVPLGRSSSDLSVDEMSNLIEFIFKWGAENGIKFNEPGEKNDD